jgi:hypothetical protein
MPASGRESVTGHNKSGLVFDESHPPSSIPDTRLSPTLPGACLHGGSSIPTPHDCGIKLSCRFSNPCIPNPKCKIVMKCRRLSASPRQDTTNLVLYLMNPIPPAQFQTLASPPPLPGASGRVNAVQATPHCWGIKHPHFGGFCLGEGHGSIPVVQRSPNECDNDFSRG